jgi:hypothetical protein
MRDVDDDAIRPGPLHLEIGMHTVAHRGIAAVFRRQPLGVRVFELLAGLVEIIDLEAEMMDPVEVGPMRADIHILFGLVSEDSDMDVPSVRNTDPFGLRRNSFRPKADL